MCDLTALKWSITFRKVNILKQMELLAKFYNRNKLDNVWFDAENQLLLITTP